MAVSLNSMRRTGQRKCGGTKEMWRQFLPDSKSPRRVPRRGLQSSCDDENMPVICPTCQNFSGASGAFRPRTHKPGGDTPRLISLCSQSGALPAVECPLDGRVRRCVVVGAAEREDQATHPENFRRLSTTGLSKYGPKDLCHTSPVRKPPTRCTSPQLQRGSR